MHEEGLDLHLIAALNQVGPRILPTSGAAMEIQTHWLGGRRHFGGWEIADIALVIVVRRVGVLEARKVALLQSKRLYSKEIHGSELEATDYLVGIGRLIDKQEPIMSLTAQRTFTFSNTSIYGALTAGSKQVKRIQDYMQTHNMPVYYSLYNPPQIPFKGKVPLLASERRVRTIKLGCRVLTAAEVHAVLNSMPTSRAPSFSKLVSAIRPSAKDAYAAHGWRLETFVADEVLRCREGRPFEAAQDEDLDRLLYRRDAPIAAAVVITIDLPRERRTDRRKSRK
jgi:hypothetical protein